MNARQMIPVALLAAVIGTVLLMQGDETPSVDKPAPGAATTTAEALVAAPAPAVLPPLPTLAVAEPPAGSNLAAFDATTGARVLRSEVAPNACSVLDAATLEATLGSGMKIVDHSTARRAEGIAHVHSSCLIGTAAGVDIMVPALMIDVWTENELQAAGLGSLDRVWQYRANDHAQRITAFPGTLAAWVDATHPPDPALLLRQGFVMIELSSQPFTSSADSPMIPKGVIEQLAAAVVQKLSTLEAERPAASESENPVAVSGG